MKGYEQKGVCRRRFSHFLFWFPRRVYVHHGGRKPLRNNNLAVFFVAIGEIIVFIDTNYHKEMLILIGLAGSHYTVTEEYPKGIGNCPTQTWTQSIMVGTVDVPSLTNSAST
jgi:hypothetical protein